MVTYVVHLDSGHTLVVRFDQASKACAMKKIREYADDDDFPMTKPEMSLILFGIRMAKVPAGGNAVIVLDLERQ